MLKILLIAGISYSGKTTLANQLVNEHPNLFVKPMQVTTREKRVGETDGVDYKFISTKTYATIKDSLSAKTEFNGYLYGTELILDSDKIQVIVVNKQGSLDFLDEANDGTDRLKVGLLHTFLHPIDATERADEADPHRKYRDLYKEMSVYTVPADITVNANVVKEKHLARSTLIPIVELFHENSVSKIFQ